MTSPAQPDGIGEARLDALRREAAETGRVQAAGVNPVGAPFPIAAPQNGYYGLPLLKKPVWTWEIPVYFFVGGAAGAAAVVAEAARFARDASSVARDARWIAAVGAALSGPLLIADLGRPDRFLHMLRVFKPQSPMSVGVWIVLAFSNAAAAALAARELDRRFPGRPALRALENTAGPAAALAGLGMATYTAVLLGATAVPVWSRNVRILPFHFAFSALGAAVGVLQLKAGTHRALNRLGLAAAAAETLMGAHLERSHARVHDPLKHGPSGWFMRAAGVLSGPVPLLLRAAGRRSPALLRIAAASAIAGSLLTRYGWITAGRASASDPREPLQLPDHARRTAPRAVVPLPVSAAQAPVTVSPPGP